jgi:hypothetical protein
MRLEIVFSHDFDPATFDGLDCKIRDNFVTAKGTVDKLNQIIDVADRIPGGKTVIMRRGDDEESKKTES